MNHVTFRGAMKPRRLFTKPPTWRQRITRALFWWLA
jgi:hypothetical protein